jgi:hypothetical protein
MNSNLKEKIEIIVNKRFQNLKYLIEVNNGNEFWMNITKLDKEDFENYLKIDEENSQKK